MSWCYAQELHHCETHMESCGTRACVTDRQTDAGLRDMSRCHHKRGVAMGHVGLRHQIQRAAHAEWPDTRRCALRGRRAGAQAALAHTDHETQTSSRWPKNYGQAHLHLTDMLAPKIHMTVVTCLAQTPLTGTYIPCPGGLRHPRLFWRGTCAHPHIPSHTDLKKQDCHCDTNKRGMWSCVTGRDLCACFPAATGKQTVPGTHNALPMHELYSTLDFCNAHPLAPDMWHHVLKKAIWKV